MFTLYKLPVCPAPGVLTLRSLFGGGWVSPLLPSPHVTVTAQRLRFGPREILLSVPPPCHVIGSASLLQEGSSGHLLSGPEKGFSCPPCIWIRKQAVSVSKGNLEGIQVQEKANLGRRVEWRHSQRKETAVLNSLGLKPALPLNFFNYVSQ